MSTDKQSADSPADQIARCRRFAAENGWQVVEDLVVVEPGVSGASRHNRPGLLGLFNRIDEWDVLLAWDFSRLTRDTEDLGWIANRLAEADRTAYDVLSGRDVFDVASQVMGVLNAFERRKISENTRRGMFGRAERGFATGGAPYGYAIADDKRLVVDPEAAETVRRIFALAAEGEGLRAIAYRLNADCVRPPRPRRNRNLGQSWAMSAVQALLENPLYKGDLVYGRTRWSKAHSTGGRRYRPTPESEWLRRQAPELAIVTPELWERVREVKRSKRAVYRIRAGGGFETTHGHPGRRRGRHLFAGLLACGECGGSFFDLHGTGFLGCGWRRDRGPLACASALRVDVAELEARVLGRHLRPDPRARRGGGSSARGSRRAIRNAPPRRPAYPSPSSR
jgi:DNA invertase Pin-like site-specific DNA recombinase